MRFQTLAFLLFTMQNFVVPNAYEMAPQTEEVVAESTADESSVVVNPDAKKAVDSYFSGLDSLPVVDQARKVKIAYCRAKYFQKRVDTDTLRPWSIMHGLIGSGRDTEVLSSGMRYNAADYLCANGAGDGMKILQVVNRHLSTREGPGVQGHQGQLLAILGQSGVSADHVVHVDGMQFTLRDLIEYEKRTCRSNTELTFKLIGLSIYLPPEATWRNEQGEAWSMERLIREEASEAITTGACGGTHRLMALSHAVASSIVNGQELQGQWLRADAIVQSNIGRILQLQNPDGSFSTDFLAGRDNDPDMTRRVYTTGHALEWLCFTMPSDQLRSSRITAAVDYLVDALLSAPNHDVDVGPRGHALHALMMYEAKVYGACSDQTDISESTHRFLAMREAYPALFEVNPGWLVVSQANDVKRNGNDSSQGSNNRRNAGVFRRR
ncbi:MAG: hypothetical protein R3C03_16600 [Pirellulaceae bacterium]